MLSKPYNYSIYLDFIESYLPTGFQDIDAKNPILQKLEGLMAENGQFFSLRNMNEMMYVFSSKGTMQVLGIDPNALNSGFFMNAVHPDDFQRLGIGRSFIMKITQEIYAKKEGSTLLSYTLRMQDAMGVYKNLLAQSYFFYSGLPRKTVFMIQVVTDVSWCKTVNHDGHYFVGNDISLFKFPDENLLKLGSIYSKRELEIIKLIASGLSSAEIADKLFLSIYTVNTHRFNILKKSGCANTSDLILDLQNKGLI